MKNIFSMPGFAWLLLTLVCILFILIGLKAVLRKTGWEKTRQQKILFNTTGLIVVWLIALTILSVKGFFADFSKLPPRPALAILVPLPFALLIAFSKKGKLFLQSIPPHWLVMMQSFRIIVELLLLAAFLNNKIPVQMTFEGRNFDVITGILALPIGYLVYRKKKYAGKLTILFNIIGIALLLNILVIAVLSMPTPIRYFMNEPSNALVGTFPFILLPGVLVPIAYTLHIFSLRKLLISRNDAIRNE